MRFTITLESETRDTIERLDSELIISSNTSWSDFKLLQYLDPYGDTIFNCKQIDDLIIDLRKLDEMYKNIIIKQTITLAEKCKAKVHTYLCFNGD
jgi:hypothetical protein